MAEDVGTIYYEVDAKTDKVIEAGRRAAEALDGLQESFDKTDRSSEGFRKTTEKTTKATEEEARALSNLLGKIDPVLAATKRLDSMQDQLSAAFNKGQISVTQYQSYLAKLDAQYKQLESSGAKAKKPVEDLTKATSNFGSSLTPIAAAVAGVITVQTLKSWAMLAEQFTLLEARVTRLSPSLTQATTNYQALLAIAAQTGQTVPATVKLWESLTASLKTLGATNDQVLTLTGTLQKIGKIGGSSAEETANALRQLGQSLAGGTLRAEEYNSIVEQTPELIRQLASASKMSMGEFRQAMLDGKITSEQLFDLLLQRVPAVNEEFKKLPRSASDAGNAVVVAFGAAISKLDQATGASKRLAAALDSVARTTNDLAGNLQGQEKFNTLIRERQIAEEQYATQVKFGLNETAAATKKRVDGLNKEIQAMQDARVEEQKRESGSGAATAPRAAKTDTVEGQKSLQQLAEQNAQLRAQGEERAKVIALQKLGTSATEQERALAVALAVDNYRLSEAEKARTKASSDGAAARRKDASETAKLETKAQADARRAAKEANTAAEADQKQFAQLGQAIANVGQTAREAAQDAAQMSLSKFATPDEVQRVRDLAGALYDLKGARAALAQADPIAAQQQNYADQLQQLQTLNDQKLLSDTRYLELKHQAEVANAEQMRMLQEENFRAASMGNDLLLTGIDNLAASGGQALAGLAAGTNSWREAVGGVAQTVLGTLTSAITEMGANWVKQQIMAAAAAETTAAVQTAGIGAVTAAQTAATGTIAATTTATAATTGTAVASSMAPAAGLASIASFGGAAVIGGAALLATMLLAKSFGGGRRAGGAVNPGSVYRVNEGGAPEIFSAGGQQYMIPNQRGEVVSNKNAEAGMAGGAGAAPIVNINNYSGQSATASTRFSEADRGYIVDVIVGDMAGGGPTAKMTNQITGTRRQGT